MVQRQKRLTKKEKKAVQGGGGGHQHEHRHIHCIACGRHVDPSGFNSSPPEAMYITCDHGSRFPSCLGCEIEARHRIREHDRTGQPVQTTPAWH